MNAVTRNIVIIGVVILAIIPVKIFLADSYRIKSDKMCDTLKSGDCVLVNKVKSKSNPGLNRLVLYKSPLRRDAVNPPLFLGRCLGMPGQTIQMGEDGFRVNGRLIENAPMMQQTFRIRKDIKEHLFNTMDLLRIPIRDAREDSLYLTLRLSLREKETLSSNLSQVVNLEVINEGNISYEIVIPRKNLAIDVSPVMLTVCSEAIMNEAGNTAVIKDNKLYINGEEKTFFFFRQNYYWLVSENEKDGIDSRHLGLIPESHIMGNVWFCWFSHDRQRVFSLIQ
ncbi:MAG: signal peptidase I [Tannerella sp.]|jgi:signal peptidase I|nr:signal peptidase I [Tannerella sp.]